MAGCPAAVAGLCARLRSDSETARSGQAQQRSRSALGDVVEDLSLLWPVVDGGEGGGCGSEGGHGGLCEHEDRHCFVCVGVCLRTKVELRIKRWYVVRVVDSTMKGG